MMSSLKISLMEAKDSAAASRLLSIAMLNNPLHDAVFLGKDEAARKKIDAMFRTLFQEHPGVVFLAKMDQQIGGVLRMKSCQGREVPDAKDTFQHSSNIAQRIVYWHHVWAQHDPQEPHWHLGPLGVLPRLQGSGVGTTMMMRFCQEVDACKAAAYLETDLGKNVRFYERFDFVVVGRADICGVENFFMWRSPKR